MPPDWESDGDTPAAKVVPKLPAKTKWEGEDEDDDGPASDWEESSEEEEEQPKVATAPPKKKGTIKAKIAEKEAEKAARQAAGEDVGYDSDEVLDPIAKLKRDREREVSADLHNAAELFGTAALGGTKSTELDSLISFQPRTKEDFQKLSSDIIEFIVKRHQNKPLYATFVEHHIRELAMPLKDIEVRKAASGLTALANEKQKEQRDKAAGKKKTKSAAKPVLGAAKGGTKFDTNLYEEALDDFGSNADDFM